MKHTPVRNGTALLLLLILTVLMLMLSLAEFAAFIDIGHDYVSETVLRRFQVPLTGELPAWTKTRREWLVVSAVFYLRIAGAIASLVLLVSIIRNSSEHEPNDQR